MLIFLASIAAAGLVFMIIGSELCKIGRAQRSEQGGVQVIAVTGGNANQSDGAAFDALKTELAGLRVMIPGVPALPARPIEFGGWFEDVFKRIEMRSEQRTLDEQINTWRRYDDLYARYLSLMKTAYAIAQTKHDFRRLGEKVSLDDRELQVRSKEIDIRLKELNLREAELDHKRKEVREGKPAREEDQRPTYEERIRARFRDATDGGVVRRIADEEAAKFEDDPETQKRIRRVANAMCEELMEGRRPK